MKKMLFLFIPLVAFAQQDYPRDITLSWTNADQYTDGSLIEAGDIVSIRVTCTRQNETTPAFDVEVPDTGEGQPQSETFVGVIPQPGTYNCVAYTIVVGNISSDASNTASRKYVGKPLPPVTFE